MFRLRPYLLTWTRAGNSLLEKTTNQKKHSIANVWKCYGVRLARGVNETKRHELLIYSRRQKESHTHRNAVSKAHYINIKMIAPSSESRRRKRHSTVQHHTWDLWPHRCDGTDGDGSLANEGCTVCNNTEHRSGESKMMLCCVLLLLQLFFFFCFAHNKKYYRTYHKICTYSYLAWWK